MGELEKNSKTDAPRAYAAPTAERWLKSCGNKRGTQGRRVTTFLQDYGRHETTARVRHRNALAAGAVGSVDCHRQTRPGRPRRSRHSLLGVLRAVLYTPSPLPALRTAFQSQLLEVGSTEAPSIQ